jgi:hypothetical protein
MIDVIAVPRLTRFFGSRLLHFGTLAAAKACHEQGKRADNFQAGEYLFQSGRAGLFNHEWTRIDANKWIPFAFIGVYSWIIIVFSLGQSLPEVTQSSVGPQLTNSRSPFR